MVAAAALGDVVQKHRDIEHAARGDLPEDRGRDRVILLELAPLDRRDEADRADRMLVHRIMVIHVELHLCDDAAEVWNEAAEHACLVHPAQHDLRPVDGRQDFHEQSVRARVFADLRVDEDRVPRGGAHRGRVDLELLAGGEGEQLEQAHGIGAKEIVLGDRDSPAVEDEAAEPLGPPPDRGKREAEALLPQLLVELGEEEAGQVADRLRVEEIELHEALDGRFPGPVGVIHDLGDPRLVLEAEPLLGPAREQVQVAPHRPEEALGPIEPAEFLGSEEPGLDEVQGLFDAMDVLADPVERVEVAKAALAILDVGLDHVAAVAHLHMPLVAFDELGGNELGGGSCDDLLAELAHGAVEQFLVAP
jgi:hypothetical protein